ncbi:MAG: enoyl-CoA hydratase/isomerase family protein [Desulfomonilaceae bacterium]
MMKCVELTVNGSVAVLRLYKPPVNALDEPSLRELAKAVEQVEEDPAVRAVIVASALEGTFCAGGDLKYWPRVYRSRADEISEAGRSAFVPLEQLTKPSIAAIQGHVIGDGLSLALACDIRLAAQGVTFHLPEVGYGFIPGWGTIGRLVRVVGTAPATELLLVGEPISAVYARFIGLVSGVTAPDQLFPAAEALAERLAAKPPMAMRHAKAALLGGSATRSPDQEDWEERCFAAVWGSQEWERGIRKLFGAAT